MVLERLGLRKRRPQEQKTEEVTSSAQVDRPMAPPAPPVEMDAVLGTSVPATGDQPATETAAPTTAEMITAEATQPEAPVSEGPASEAPSAQEPAAPANETYTVQSGDTLSAIALRFYGDANDYTRIFEANRDKLDNPDMIQPGQELVIPR